MSYFDYRELLIKYIQHVGEQEGIDFLSDTFSNPDLFSEVEWEQLKLLANEAT